MNEESATRRGVIQQAGYVSILVRLWHDQQTEDRGGNWHGEIEHVQTGTRWNFSAPGDLLAFLQHVVLTQPVAAGAFLQQPGDNQ